MNFSFFALTMALATSSVAAGPVRKTFKLGSRNLRKNSPVTKALMKKARPYKASGNVSRKLQENDIDGTYSFKFSQCVDIKTYDEESFANYAEQIQAGTVLPTKSYVIFHVCQNGTCGYEAEDDLYIVDLHTYLGTVATFHAEKKGNYCEACNEFADYCNPEAEEEAADDAAAAEDAGVDEDAAEGDAANEEDAAANEGEDREAEDGEAEGEQENEARKLKTQRRMKEAIDCDQCQAYECYTEDDGGNDLDEQAAEWIKKVSECQQAEVQVNGVDVFYGAMCDDYGDGVELAVFLDDECSLYTSQIAFNNVYMKEEGNDAYNYLTYAENYIKSAFSDVMSCNTPQYYADNGEDDAQEEEQYELNDYCEQILKDDAFDYTQCAADEDAQQLVTEDGYSYDIAYDRDLDIEEVCSVIKRMENAGEYYNAYDASGSGTWYKRDKTGKIIVEAKGQEAGMSGGAIFGIIALIAAVVGGAAFFVMKKKEKKGDIAESAEYQGGALS